MTDATKLTPIVCKADVFYLMDAALDAAKERCKK